MAKKRVLWVDDPNTVGTILEEGGGEARVRWDDDPKNSRGQWYLLSDLRPAHGKRKSNPVSVHAPEVQDLEFATRLHPITNTLIMERAEDFRGAPGPALVDAEEVWNCFQHMSELDQEHIVVILLDVRHNMLGWKMVHKGQISGVEASVKDMLKDAILGNAAKVIVLHNHPSGDPSPSEADKDLTAALEVLGSEFQIDLWDHVIIGRISPDDPDFVPFYSFRDDGQLEEPEEDDGT